MKRRDFIQTTAAGAVLPMLLNGFPIAAYGDDNAVLAALTNAATQTDRVLVLVQLNGGNDGLNMVIPLDQYPALMAARGNIALPQNQVLPLTQATGLHPAMAGLKGLYDNAQVGVVQSVGYPNPNFSHFRATDIWTSASASNVTWTTGWAGRYLDGEYPGFPTGYPNAQVPDPLAVTVGSVVSNCVQGPTVNMGMAIASTSSFYQLLTGTVDQAPNTPAGHELTFIRQVVQQTQVYTTAIQRAAAAARNLSPLWPTAGQNTLADQLKIVAQLIAGGLQTRIYCVNLGGFDTHATQVPTTGPTTTGTHATLLGKVSQAVEAFQDDLRRLSVQHRVVGMTFSEFGRRIKSNSGFGTDHGAAAPLFVFGTSVNPLIHGQNVQLPASVGVNDNVPMQFDFRAIYASILKDWFAVPAATLTALFGQAFPYVPVLRPGVVNGTTTAADVEVAGFSVYPNPVRDRATVAFECQGGHVQVVVYDHVGREVQRLVDRVLPRGQQALVFRPTGLAAGTYHCHVQEDGRSSARLVVVEP
ncbi:DUF1501 domain-containing protein [Hymenobacter busanensis]|uniref:DUF1501 domain-containing protein n=1 Tax=Hymenobacter busanensis TaxID=2607656 RepID=A0A7L5A312_9BACT|nr:DUF1501 domain-containing protein [Hymenobacter busanensis]KAA9333115.1 DUF1501 domain-containing protein [Hymenobacter busanensis]QHJ08210.1 DUF1501 domain-containing protein [Hymenobacter busanensis]